MSKKTLARVLGLGAGAATLGGAYETAKGLSDQSVFNTYWAKLQYIWQNWPELRRAFPTKQDLYVHYALPKMGSYLKAASQCYDSAALLILAGAAMAAGAFVVHRSYKKENEKEIK